MGMADWAVAVVTVASLLLSAVAALVGYYLGRVRLRQEIKTTVVLKDSDRPNPKGKGTHASAH